MHHGFVEIRLHLVAQLGVAQQMFDFVGVGSLNRRHGQLILQRAVSKQSLMQNLVCAESVTNDRTERRNLRVNGTNDVRKREGNKGGAPTTCDIISAPSSTLTTLFPAASTMK